MSEAFDELLSAASAAPIPDDAVVLVAVSGGPDSIALLAVLHALASPRRWTLYTGHINHALRGEESDEDERFVVGTAARLGVPCLHRRVEVIRHAGAYHASPEEAAREQRYAALESMCAEVGASLIATGHTLDDQAETVLLRLTRGTGLQGLGAMAPLRDRIVRPLLSVRRSTVLRALDDKSLSYRTDSSNRDERFARNVIRHRVMPVLGGLNPEAATALARAAHSARIDYAYLQHESEAALDRMHVDSGSDGASASLPVWRGLHPALQRETLRLLAARVLGDLRGVDESHIAMVAECLRDEARPTGVLPRGLKVFVRGSRFRLGRDDSGSEGPSARFGTEVSQPGLLQPGTLEVNELGPAERADIETLIAVCGPLHALCDAAALRPPLSLRTRVPGDRMRPLGAPGSRKVQDIMVDHRVPRADRDSWPVVCDTEGIVWLPGLIQAHRTAVGPTTTRVLHLYWKPNAPAVP